MTHLKNILGVSASLILSANLLAQETIVSWTDFDQNTSQHSEIADTLAADFAATYQTSLSGSVNNGTAGEWSLSNTNGTDRATTTMTLTNNTGLDYTLSTFDYEFSKRSHTTSDAINTDWGDVTLYVSGLTGADGRESANVQAVGAAN